MRLIYLLLLFIFIAGCTANEKTNSIKQNISIEHKTEIQSNKSEPENNSINQTIKKPNESVSKINITSNVPLNNSNNLSSATNISASNNTNSTLMQPVQLDKYIMAFLACDTSINQCNDPRSHTTYLAQSNGGTSWELLTGFKPFLGSVPDVIRRKNTLYIYNPGSLTRYHLDSGIQEPQTRVLLKDANGMIERAGFVDPSIIDNNGKFVLFYLPGIMGQDPARCPVGQLSCTKQIMSATEIPGSDGAAFTIDDGARANIQISGNFATASDPAVFNGPDGYYLYISEGQSVVALFSQSLQGSYSYIQGLQNGMLTQQGGVPAGYYDSSTGQFWTFVTQGSVTQIIKLAKTSNLNSLIPGSSFTTIISGCTFSGLGCSYSVASPAIHIGNPEQ